MSRENFKPAPSSLNSLIDSNEVIADRAGVYISGPAPADLIPQARPASPAPAPAPAPEEASPEESSTEPSSSTADSPSAERSHEGIKGLEVLRNRIRDCKSEGAVTITDGGDGKRLTACGLFCAVLCFAVGYAVICAHCRMPHV